MISIYKLEEKFNAVKQALIQSGGEITLDVTEALEELKAEREEKLEACAVLLKNLDAELDLYKSQISKRKARATSLEVQADEIEKIVRKLLPYDEKFKRGLHKLSYTPSTAVIIVDEKLLPSQYVKEEIVRTPDKKAIGAVLKDNPEAVIAGADLEHRYNLQVK